MNKLDLADKIYIESYMKSNNVSREWQPYLQNFLQGYHAYKAEIAKRFSPGGS